MGPEDSPPLSISSATRIHLNCILRYVLPSTGETTFHTQTNQQPKLYSCTYFELHIFNRKREDIRLRTKLYQGFPKFNLILKSATPSTDTIPTSCCHFVSYPFHETRTYNKFSPYLLPYQQTNLLCLYTIYVVAQ